MGASEPVRRLAEAMRSPLVKRAVLRRASGHAVVEMAFLVTILMLLGFGTFEFGRGFLTQLVVVNAARDGARVGMDAGVTNAQITAAVNNAAAPLVPTSVAISRPSGQVRVTVTYDFDSEVGLINSFWGGGTLTIGHTAVSRPG